MAAPPQKGNPHMAHLPHCNRTHYLPRLGAHRLCCMLHTSMLLNSGVRASVVPLPACDRRGALAPSAVSSMHVLAHLGLAYKQGRGAPTAAGAGLKFHPGQAMRFMCSCTRRAVLYFTLSGCVPHTTHTLEAPLGTYVGANASRERLRLSSHVLSYLCGCVAKPWAHPSLEACRHGTARQQPHACTCADDACPPCSQVHQQCARHTQSTTGSRAAADTLFCSQHNT